MSSVKDLVASKSAAEQHEMLVALMQRECARNGGSAEDAMTLAHTGAPAADAAVGGYGTNFSAAVFAVELRSTHLDTVFAAYFGKHFQLDFSAATRKVVPGLRACAVHAPPPPHS
jgi:hypothetical protein